MILLMNTYRTYGAGWRILIVIFYKHVAPMELYILHQWLWL